MAGGFPPAILIYKQFYGNIDIMSDMSNNVIKSTDLPESSKPVKAAAKKTTAKKAAAKKIDSEPVVESDVVSSEEAPVVEKSPLPDKSVAKASNGKKFVFFSSGSAYSTKEGIRFTRDKRIYEIDEEEADHLLSFDNFRLPTQLELEEYYKENT